MCIKLKFVFSVVMKDKDKDKPVFNTQCCAIRMDIYWSSNAICICTTHGNRKIVFIGKKSDPHCSNRNKDVELYHFFRQLHEKMTRSILTKKDSPDNVFLCDFDQKGHNSV